MTHPIDHVALLVPRIEPVLAMLGGLAAEAGEIEEFPEPLLARAVPTPVSAPREAPLDGARRGQNLAPVRMRPVNPMFHA
jgi:hypothetical protein